MIDIESIDLDKYKNKCLLIQKGKCRNVNLFIEQSNQNKKLKDCLGIIEEIMIQCLDDEYFKSIAQNILDKIHSFDF